LNFDFATVEIFSIEPGYCTLSGGGVIISYGSFSFLITSITIFVNPNLWFAGSLVILDNSN